MYAKLKISVESTIDEIDMAEMQREKFEKLQEMEMGDSLGDELSEVDKGIDSLGKNEVAFDFFDLEPVTDRVKLDGDEYEKSRKRANKNEATASATMEVYKSLDTLPLEHLELIKQSLDDALLCGTLLGYPMVNTRVRILDGRYSNIRSKNPLVF